eukprot:7147472-Pyramimonas_sp.AAC.1
MAGCLQKGTPEGTRTQSQVLRLACVLRCLGFRGTPKRTSYAVAMDMAVGKVSLLDWDMFTWSFGWIGFFDPRGIPKLSLALLAMTSFRFMLVCVPEPVCHTTSGKCSLSFPSITS